MVHFSLLKLYMIGTEIAIGFKKISQLHKKSIFEMCIMTIFRQFGGLLNGEQCTNITVRKDGRYMGKFIVGYDDSGKAQYQYVYGKTYDEAESKVLIGQEVASRYLSGRYITVGKVYEEWLNAIVNRVKESSLANYKAKFEKHILPTFGDIPCADLSAGRINEFIVILLKNRKRKLKLHHQVR